MANSPSPEEPRSPQSNEPPAKPDQKAHWMDQLALRSAGLPGTSKDGQKKPQADKSPWALAGAGIQFAGTTAVFAFIGIALDSHFGWTPWATIGFSVLGFVGGLYLLIKQFLNQDGG